MAIIFPKKTFKGTIFFHCKIEQMATLVRKCLCVWVGRVGEGICIKVTTF